MIIEFNSSGFNLTLNEYVHGPRQSNPCSTFVTGGNKGAPARGVQHARSHHPHLYHFRPAKAMVLDLISPQCRKCVSAFYV